MFNFSYKSLLLFSWDLFFIDIESNDSCFKIFFSNRLLFSFLNSCICSFSFLLSLYNYRQKKINTVTNKNINIKSDILIERKSIITLTSYCKN